jgi:hypothetical protein
MPHPFAWKSGTIARTVSSLVKPMPSRLMSCIAWSQWERWVYTTPFGSPVVPDV